VNISSLRFGVSLKTGTIRLTYQAPDDVDSGGDRPALTSSAARANLAAELYWKLERLDPTGGRVWSELNEHEKRLYELSVEHLLGFEDWIGAALNGPGDDLIAFKPDIRE
jgi:hypothetical protein